MKEIYSRQNEEIKTVSRLKTEKNRISRQEFLAEGFRVCKALACTIAPNSLYCTPIMLEKAKMLITKDQIEKKIILVNDSVMEKISSATTPSGLLGVFSIPKTPSPEALSSGIVLANISDPGNMGTLIRTCAAMGLKSVVSIGGVDPFAQKVIQATAGEIGKVTIFNLSWEQLLAHKKQLKLIALVVSGGKSPENINFKNSLLIIGSEAHGIAQDWIKDCDETLTLLMPGKTESLNAAIAGSIAMYFAIK